jgi:CheY-like chemotaxis protein
VQAVSASVGRLRGVHVLVVEDDADTRDLVDVVLGSEGAVTTLSAGGHEAFAAFGRRRPDLLLSDLRMPDGDGYELARRIRELSVEDGKLTPAVAVSASENARPAILAGYHAFVAKPFDVDRLVDVVEDFTRPPERVTH